MNELERIIVEEIRKKGKLSLKEFIELSLYHPDFGYYSKKHPGKGGDFYTSPTASPLFGYTIANFIKEMDEVFRNPEVLRVVEIGGGKGILAKDILDFLREDDFSVFKRLEYIIVERFVRSQEKSIRFIQSIEELEEIEGIIISNEFFDSLPFRIIENFKGKIMEVYLSYKGKLVEELMEPSDEVLEYLGRFPVELEEGERTELRWEDYKFMKNLSKKLKKGFILTIDYGSERSRLNTYRAYKNHNVFDNIIEEPGCRDITSDVNFDLLRRAGEEEGLEEVFFMTQEKFLLKFGILEIIEKSGKSYSLINQAKILLSPEIMGGRFKVLLQKKIAI